MDKCTKKAFESYEEANNRIKEIRDTNYKHDQKSKRPKRSYMCSICGKIHITSMSRGQKEMVIQKKLNHAKGQGIAIVSKKYGDDLPKFEKIKKKSK